MDDYKQEIETLRELLLAMEPLDEAARVRVLQYVMSYFGIDGITIERSQ